MVRHALERGGEEAGVGMAGEDGPDPAGRSQAPGRDTGGARGRGFPETPTTRDRPDAPDAPAVASAPQEPVPVPATPPTIDAARVETLPPTTPAEPAPATPLGSRYMLDGVIGSGATGRVWRGRRRDDDAPVAVKMLRGDFTDDPDAVVRFLRQKTALVTLDHPHLVQVHDLVAEGEVLAIVMDLVEGEDLRRLAARRALRTDQQLAVVAQVASALTAVHSIGVVHRDIKPENILVTWRNAEPYALLTDFGLARITDAPNLTRMSQLVGTPAYIAPELVESRPAGPASDVYSLGVTLYELLAGRRPFHGESTAALLRAHLDTEPARPPGLPEPLWALLRACLAKDPAARPGTALLAEHLRALGEQAQVPPQPIPPPPPASDPGQVPTAERGLSRGGPAPYPPHPSGASGRPGPPGPPGPQAEYRQPGYPDAGHPQAGPAGLVPPTGARLPTGGAPPAGGGPGAGTAAPSGAPVFYPAAAPVDPPPPGDVAVPQPTTGATRPAQLTPTPPAPPPRRRTSLWIALAACILLGTGAGLWFGRPDERPPAAPAAKPSTSPYRLLYLPVTAISTRPGTIRLDFPDSASMPGFRFYVIFRDRYKIAEAPSGQVPPYHVYSVDQQTQHCWTVAALLETDQPPPSTRTKPTCKVADGRAAEN